MRYSTCKYTVTLKPGLGVTQGHRKLYHSIRHIYIYIYIYIIQFEIKLPKMSYLITATLTGQVNSTEWNMVTL